MAPEPLPATVGEVARQPRSTLGVRSFSNPMINIEILTVRCNILATEVIVGVYGTSGHVADEYGPSKYTYPLITAFHYLLIIF